MAGVATGSSLPPCSFSLVVSTAGVETNPTNLIDGQLQVDSIPRLQEHFYIFKTTPEGSLHDIEISLDSIVGDTDLFVNPKSLGRGFYHRSQK